MQPVTLPDDLVVRSGDGGRILMLVLDGLGGLPRLPGGPTELEAARTPALDALAARSSLGLLTPVGPGITPGSGPGHLALFGYDPLRYVIGRGALSALGVGFPLRPGDLAVRLNLATLDASGRITDRRAGRPLDEEGARVVEKVRNAVSIEDGVELHLLHEKEHRAVLVLRGEGLEARIADTDPQEEGVPPRAARALDEASERSARILRSFLESTSRILADEERVHTFLARGFASYQGFPTFQHRFGLRAMAVARYPMYRGVARLVGMEVVGEPESADDAVSLLEDRASDFDFAFFHVKAPDARGEDGDFDGKVAAIEEVDGVLARLLAPEWNVVCVTGDHSTPAVHGAHSWHPVPLLIRSDRTRPSAGTFGESTCRLGDLGHVVGKDLLAHLLAHAGRLEKYGA